MKRVVALVAGLVVLAGCGAAGMEPVAEAQYTTTQPAFTTIRSVPENKADHYNERFPCVASLPEDDIYLYWIQGQNYNGKMVLFQEERETIFDDWGYWKYDYPKLSYNDFDGDGNKEIAAITIVGSGTGLCITDLHILNIHRNYVPYHESIEYEEFTLSNEDVTDFFEKNLKYKHGKKANTLELKIDGNIFMADLDPSQTWLGKIESGSHVYFSFKDDGIKLRTIMSAHYEEGPPWGDSFGHFIADVIFDGKQISLTNIQLVPPVWPIPEE